MKTRNQEPQSSTSGSGISGLDVLFLVFLTGALFYPYIFRDQLPFPTDIILALQRNENIWAGKGSVDNLYTTDCVVDCYPRAYHAWTQRRESYHPNWYPYSSCGQPNYQNPTRSPLMILGDVMNPADAYALGMVVSVGLSGLTMLLFLWELGVSRGARWAGAALYMLCGNSVYFLPLLHFTEATAALPLLLLAIRRLSLDGRGPDGATPLTGGYRATQGVLLAFSFAWILLSRADIAILTVALSGSYGLYLVALRPGSRVRRLMLMAFAATCGLGLAFFEIGPFLSVLQASPRVQRKGSATWNPVENLERVGITIAGAVVPDILGDPSTSSSRLPYHHKPYCGIVPLILLAFFRRGRDTSFFLAALVFCLLCGTNTPLRNLAIGLYPPLGFFDPYRCFWMTMPCMAVLFARGIDALHDDSSSEDRGRIVIGVGALAFAGAVLILLFATPGRLEPIFQRIAASRFEADTREYQERFDVDSRRRSYQDRWTTLRQTLLKAMVLATLALVVLYGRRRFGTRFTLASLLALLLVDLYPFAWRYLSGGPRSDLYPPTPEIRYLQDQDGWFRTLPLGYLIAPNSAAMYDLICVNGYGSLKLGDFQKLWEALGGEAGHGMDMHVFPEEPVQRRALQMMGVRFVLSDQPLDAEGLKLRAHVMSYLYEDRSAWPRVTLFTNWVVVPDATSALPRVLDPAFDLGRVAIVEGEAGGVTEPDPPTAESVTGRWSLVHEGSDHLVLDVSVPSRTLLFLSTRKLPGWRVRVDGRPARLECVNHSFLGVFLEPGDHRVAFFYSFIALEWGRMLSLLISVASLLLLASNFWCREISVHGARADLAGGGPG